jgi:hypothetical protein
MSDIHHRRPHYRAIALGVSLAALALAGCARNAGSGAKRAGAGPTEMRNAAELQLRVVEGKQCAVPGAFALQASHGGSSRYQCIGKTLIDAIEDPSIKHVQVSTTDLCVSESGNVASHDASCQPDQKRYSAIGCVHDAGTWYRTGGKQFRVPAPSQPGKGKGIAICVTAGETPRCPSSEDTDVQAPRSQLPDFWCSGFITITRAGGSDDT